MSRLGRLAEGSSLAANTLFARLAPGTRPAGSRHVRDLDHRPGQAATRKRSRVRTFVLALGTQPIFYCSLWLSWH
jgi:hypothetical protein